jgi:16S rRNA (cytosine967-C5)-methyltransferase
MKAHRLTQLRGRRHRGGSRRLPAVNPKPTESSPSGSALPLAQLLEHAARAVAQVRAGRSLTEALTATPAAARGGAQALSFLALRHLGRALWLREQWVKKPPEALHDALLLSALALLSLPADEAPYAAHTLVNQAVLAARRLSKPGSPFSGLLNAVLRRCLREAAQWQHSLAALPEGHTARSQHPPWWVQRLQADWPEHSQAVLHAAQQMAPMTLRVRAPAAEQAQARERYLQRLQGMGLSARACGPQALMLDKALPVEKLPGFAQGEVSVQDAAAQRAAPLLLGLGEQARAAGLAPLPPGARVLDACAAPGGKTVHLLELADVRLLALDRDPQRLQRVGENLARGAVQAQLLAADAGSPASWWDGQPFDAILLDAPCSASGIVRRHPDVRWLRRPSDIEALAREQARLLDALWPLLAPGGRLLYCTCSVFKAEGREQIDAFLQRRQPQSDVLEWPSPGHLLPMADNAQLPAQAAFEDGFFYALLQKVRPAS